MAKVGNVVGLVGAGGFAMHGLTFGTGNVQAASQHDVCQFLLRNQSGLADTVHTPPNSVYWSRRARNCVSRRSTRSRASTAVACATDLAKKDHRPRW